MRGKRFAAAIVSALCLATAAATSAGAATPSRTETPDGMGFVCSRGQLCLHFMDIRTHKYDWTRWSACTWHNVPSGKTITWYINNQTGGARGRFDFFDGHVFITPYAYSSGDPQPDYGNGIVRWKTC
jgi:hypothetical protein